MSARGPYRLNQTEIEEAIYSLSSDLEVCVVGVPPKVLSQAVAAIIARPPQWQEVTREFVIRGCRSILLNFMVPGHVELVDGSLPRNTNGKIDRKMLSMDFQKLFCHLDLCCARLC
ncbi:AMP-binding enzyme [Collimonas fungivorans]|uniref:AMP-binding enzyme n=1 Tax=Collimonas fungivorans TaxID=158899 RepID=UPI0009ED4CE0|nr:acyl--CoA ligase [Collimonas fungivorans]